MTSHMNIGFQSYSAYHLTLHLEGGLAGGTELSFIQIPSSNCRLQITLPVGSPFHNSETTLFTNHAQDGSLVIEQSSYYFVLADIDFFIEITKPGNFFFYLENKNQKGPKVFFLVDPIVNIGKKQIPLSGVNLQTNYARCIGKLDEWLTNLKPISDIGYNMIHFPPYQVPGDDSHYSLQDQLKPADILFPDYVKEEEKCEFFKKTLKEVEEKLGIGFMIDLVMNHTNPKSKWLHDHPEVAFNTENTPHLKSAAYLDDIIQEFSEEVEAGKYPDLPADVPFESVGILRGHLWQKIFNSDLKRFFFVSGDAALEILNQDNLFPLTKNYEMLRMRSVSLSYAQRINILRAKGIEDDGKHEMDSLKVKPQFAAALYQTPNLDKSKLDEFKSALITINEVINDHFVHLVDDIVQNVMNIFNYEKYDPNGPKRGPITRDRPIVWRYFAVINASDGKKYHCACNGWIISEKPNVDFIAPGTDFYLRRQIMIWGDCVKLKYGEKPEDNPYLWEYMGKYVKSVAEVAHAVRIDNCHSTPINAGEYFVHLAREINPNLFVMAELFTGGDQEALEYINRMGLNFLLREGTHNRQADKMSGLLLSCGGRHPAPLDSLVFDSTVTPVKHIPGVVFDISHDNLAPNYDPISLLCAISLSCSPIASTRGFDDCLNYNPSCVTEYRKYPLSEDKPALQRIRELTNKLHLELALSGCDEISTSFKGNIFSIFRCNSKTGNGAWMLVRFPGQSTAETLECPSTISSLYFEGRLEKIEHQNNEKDIVPSQVEFYLNSNLRAIRSCVIINQRFAQLTNFPENSVVCFRTKFEDDIIESMDELSIDDLKKTFEHDIQQLDLVDINLLMFGSSSEEHERIGQGTYNVPDLGEIFYNGTQGFAKTFDIHGHSMGGMESAVFHNVRVGDWMLDHILSRFSKFPILEPIYKKMQKYLLNLKTFPRFVIPKLLSRLITTINSLAQERIFSLLIPRITTGISIEKNLLIASVAFYGKTQTPLVDSNILKWFSESNLHRPDCSLCAGLPHFASGVMRSWGRDTFISLRGMFLVTKRFKEARDHILAFASCLRHGLIPNLHDSCKNPRYNARDATWWFLQAIQEYVKFVDEGEDILKSKIPKLFPTDNQQEFKEKWENNPERPIVTLEDIVQEIMEKHANGIDFVEWNAGPGIDSIMKESGFHVQIVTSWNNGFILGGNGDNCGTWMDKMGSSHVGKNFGIPATPRDGAAIEIIGLLQSTLKWLNHFSSLKLYSKNGVLITNTNKFVTWSEWSNLIMQHFESWFYIPTLLKHDQNYFIESKKVMTRGIYKDTVGGSSEFADYQFRPNIVIAMTVAPELFDKSHANKCLNLITSKLLGKIGMKTLEDSDIRYRGVYNNDAETDDFYSSKGFNYHNGCEWVWLTGFYFRACMNFQRDFVDDSLRTMANIDLYLKTSSASGLPELTNADGVPCNASCANQTWSIATILDTIDDYKKFKRLSNYYLGLDDDEIFPEDEGVSLF